METKREMDFQTLAAWLHAFPPGWKPRLKGGQDVRRHHIGCTKFKCLTLLFKNWPW